jgi:hypothetical protein
MTKLIAILLIALAVWAGWKLVAYYQHVEAGSPPDQSATETVDIRPDQLTGLPAGLADSLAAAQKGGPRTLRDWLKAHGGQVQDPRKAWIEMDYCLAVLRDNPQEALRVYRAVRDRTATNSPVYPRIQQLEKTFE